MRRLTSVLTLVVLCIAGSPAPASAYFWEWVDKMSGPRYRGVLYEWRAWCDSQKGSDVLRKFAEHLQAKKYEYEVEANKTSHAAAKSYFGEAATAIDGALRYVDEAIEALQKQEGPRSPSAGSGREPDADALILEALKWKKAAATSFEKGKSAPNDAKFCPNPSIAAIPDSDGIKQKIRFRAIAPLGVGIAVSLCDAKPYERSSRFLQVNVGFGFERQGKFSLWGLIPGRSGDADSPQDPSGPRPQNRIVTFGASYHSVLKPYLTAGVGAGLATFSSDQAQGFNKLYIEPYIIDLKPFATWGDPAYRSVWRHMFYVRYSTITFPEGFEPGSFPGRTAERYPAEIIHSIGLHADLEPLIRKLQGNWR